jgi:hypothetical protein
MLYIASVPGFILTLGMQFAVDSPRWLCKVGLIHSLFQILFLFLCVLFLMLSFVFLCQGWEIG